MKKDKQGRKNPESIHSKKQKKKPYKSPTIISYGKVSELTQGRSPMKSEPPGTYQS